MGRICVGNLKNYILLYMKGGGELSCYDLEIMPYLYYLQLARSTYGYEEYLLRGRRGFITDRSENLEALLEFGFWRTEMCRWLEKESRRLSQELAVLAKQGMGR